MKTKIVFCFFVIAVFFTGQSLANQSVGFEPEYPALTFLQEEGQWEKFIAAAKNNKAVVTCQKVDGSNTECLKPEYVARGAFNFASKNPQLMNLVAENQRGETAYMDLFMAYNNFPKGGGLPLEQFHKLATGQIHGTGILYPVNSEYLKSLKGVKVAQAPESVQTDATPAIAVVQPAVKPAEVAKPSETEAQISDLQNQIANLKKTLAGNTKAIGRLAGLEKKLNELVGSVSVLGKGQTALAQNQAKISASMDEITSSLTEIRNQYQEELIAVKNEISSTKSEIYADIEAMAKAIELNQIIIVVWLLGTIGAVFVIILQLRRRDNKKIDNLRVDLNSTSDMVAEMRVEDLNSKECTDGLSLQKVSRSKIDSMEIGEEIEVVYEIPGKIMTIKVCRISKKTLRLFNVKRRANDQKDYTDISFNSNVAETITRAIVDDRVVGGSVTVSQVVA